MKQERKKKNEKAGSLEGNSEMYWQYWKSVAFRSEQYWKSIAYVTQTIDFWYHQYFGTHRRDAKTSNRRIGGSPRDRRDSVVIGDGYQSAKSILDW